jgi:hypothetical protein
MIEISQKPLSGKKRVILGIANEAFHRLWMRTSIPWPRRRSRHYLCSPTSRALGRAAIVGGILRAIGATAEEAQQIAFRLVTPGRQKP